VSDEKKFRALMKRVYRKAPARQKTAAEDFAFHMYDAANNVAEYAEMLRNPDAFNTEDARRVVTGVVVHLVGHLLEASRLYEGDVIDPFRKATTARRGRSRSRARARG